MTLNLTKEQQKRLGFLQELANKYGDFRVNILFEDKGKTHSSKWHSVMKCWESDKGLWFLSQANQRTLLPHEIILDLDGIKDIKELWQICETLTKAKENFIAYHSGGKGYHIHIYATELLFYDKKTREQLREDIIRGEFKEQADIQLKSENHTIQIENTPHRKTLRKKTRLSGNWELL